jgi:hypothetical protein
LSPEQTENELKLSMATYLNNEKHKDNTPVKFTVLEVVYYEDKTVYDCQFKVEMQEPGHDTVGSMFAWISKDFATVKRKY